MSLQDLDICISKLRYIPSECVDRCSEDNFWLNKDWCMQNCEARSDDVNDIIRCLDLIYRYSRNVGLDPVILDRVRPYLDKLTYVSSGDIMLPDHHNMLVDAMKALVNAIDEGFRSLMRGPWVSDYTVDVLLLYESGIKMYWAGVLLMEQRIYKPVPASGKLMFVDVAYESFMAVDILTSEIDL